MYISKLSVRTSVLRLTHGSHVQMKRVFVKMLWVKKRVVLHAIVPTTDIIHSILN